MFQAKIDRDSASCFSEALLPLQVLNVALFCQMSSRLCLIEEFGGALQTSGSASAELLSFNYEKRTL